MYGRHDRYMYVDRRRQSNGLLAGERCICKIVLYMHHMTADINKQLGWIAFAFVRAVISCDIM